VANGEHEAGTSLPRFASTWQIIALGVGYLFLAALSIYLIGALWPEKSATEPNKWQEHAQVFWWTFTIGIETRLIWLVVVAGALGSYVHGATSFATYVGNRTLIISWLWWYILRTPIGIVLALLLYFVLRGGLLSAGAGGDVLSPFGVAAIAGLAGMFSKQATDKLREVFDNLFRTAPGRGDEERKDKTKATPPEIERLEPDSIASGAGPTKVQVTGKNFTATSIVQVGGTGRRTEYVGATQLNAYLEPNDLARPGSLLVTVANPPPAAATSNGMNLKVT
jgi:hypothetical protein